MNDTADVYREFIFDLKILEAIKNIGFGEKKTTNDKIDKCIIQKSLEIQEEILQALIANLEEEGILKNSGDHSRHYSKKLQKPCKRKMIKKDSVRKRITFTFF